MWVSRSRRARNARVVWATTVRSRGTESVLALLLLLPHLQGNKHPFVPVLKQLRKTAKDRAERLPIVRSWAGRCGREPTARQADEGERRDVRQRVIAGYAIEHGLTIENVFIERGVSGSRPLAGVRRVRRSRTSYGPLTW